MATSMYLAKLIRTPKNGCFLSLACMLDFFLLDRSEMGRYARQGADENNAPYGRLAVTA